jgi:hypothetical protein
MDRVLIGKSPYRATPETYGLFQADRRRHVYIIGKSGTGKTTLLENLIVQDIVTGRGVGVIDPHGDLADRLLDVIPRYRTHDVIYFNPNDRSNPIGFNLLASVPDEQVSVVVEGIVSACKSVWHDSWGPRLEYILGNTLAALLPAERTTLLSVPRFLTDTRYRARVLEQVSDPMVRYFFMNEYDRYPERLRLEAIAPIQNEIGAFLLSQPIRYIVGQARSSLDFRAIMDGRKIFIANLSKGRIGPQTSNLLGSLLVTQFQLTAMARSLQPEEERVDFNLFIDEFQNFATQSFTTILAEARKFRLSLHLAHQYLGQLPDEIRTAVFGNVGTMISFAIGEADAPVLAREFYPNFREDDLIDLARGEVILKRSSGGRTLPACRAYVFEPYESIESHSRRIIRASRQRYGTPRRKVEKRLQKAFGTQKAPATKRGQRRNLHGLGSSRGGFTT